MFFASLVFNKPLSQVFACLVITKDNYHMQKKEIRRLRLKEWFKDKTLPPKEKSYLSQLMSGRASFGEKAARRIEQTYGMPEGYLDAEYAEQSEVSPPHAGLTSNQLELLQIFSAFPEDEQRQIISELKQKKESMEDLIARWIAAQKCRRA